MSDVFVFFLRSINGYAPPSSLFASRQGVITFASHETALADGSRYGHTFNFERIEEITTDDTVVVNETVPFREIHIDYLDDTLNNVIMTSDINLDT